MKSIKVTFLSVKENGQFRVGAITYPNGGQNPTENDLVTVMNILRMRQRPVVRDESENNEFAYEFAMDF